MLPSLVDARRPRDAHDGDTIAIDGTLLLEDDVEECVDTVLDQMSQPLQQLLHGLQVFAKLLHVEERTALAVPAGQVCIPRIKPAHKSARHHRPRL